MNLSRKFLACAIVALLPMGGALACTTGAWDGTTGTPVADDPDTSTGTNNNPDGGAVKRYSGNCGLAPVAAAANYVTDNNVGDTIYRARWYAFTGIATGSPRMFEAFSADNGGGSSIFSATYNRAGNSFDFTAAGTTIPSITVAPNRWYSVEIFHNAGNQLTVSVQGNNSAVLDAPALTATSAAAVAGTIQSVRLGNTNGDSFTLAGASTPTNSNGFSVDEFDSTRSASTAIGRLCRGDANNSGNDAVGDNDINVQDASLIVAERLGQQVAPGQPDANEDGIVNVQDASLVVSMRLASPPKRCN
jgi:hypothetical protein